jgi:protein-tyrosine phosphatase
MPSKLLLYKIKNLLSVADEDASRGYEAVGAQKKIRILFVCMGNICRSPTARGVFEKLVEQARLTHAIEADSAGTYAGQEGKPADPRAVRAAAKRGYDLTRQRARRFNLKDFEKYDYILAMDLENLNDMRAMMTDQDTNKVRLLMDFADVSTQVEVPDHYYGGGCGFERVLDLVEDAARGLIEYIRAEHRL